MTSAGAGASGLTATYDVGLVMIGLYTTALAIPYALLQFPAGNLVDRVGVRRAALLGLGLVVFAYLVASTIALPALALTARAAAGAGSAVCFVAGAELARRSDLGAASLGVFGGLTIGAGGLAVLIVPAAESLLGWRAAWVTSAVVAAVAMLAVWWAEPAGARVQGRSTDVSAPGPSLWRDGELHRLGSIHAVTLGLPVVLSNFAAAILREEWSLPPAGAAATGSVILAAAILSRPLGGWLTRRHPDRGRALTTAALLGCAGGAMLLAWPGSWTLAIVAVVVLGVCSGVPFAVVIGGAQIRGRHRPGAAVGLVNGHANVLLVVGTPMLGAAIERQLVTPALLLLGGLFLLPLLAPPRTLDSSPRSAATTDG